MPKHITIYQPNRLGEIEKIETVDGVVVEESTAQSSSSKWDNVWSFFYSHGSTVGGNEWEKKYERPTDGNGREYNPVSGNWEYTEQANGNANPYQCNYEAPQDNQGSVPCWDGEG